MISHRLTEGGFWRSARPKYSKDTVDLLEVLIKESRLSLSKQHWIKRSLDEDHPLPLSLENNGTQHPANGIFEPHQKSFRKVRTRAEIIRSGAYQCQPFQPKEDHSNRDKELLQNIMAFGSEVPEVPTPSLTNKHQVDFSIATLELEIKERLDFLANMEKIGLGKKYRPIINAQISKRRRDLRLIENGKLVPLDHIEIYNNSAVM